MTEILFTGKNYSGFDGIGTLSFNKPGTYEVSDEKARQLSTDFPHEFSIDGSVPKTIEAEIVEDEPEVIESAPAKTEEAPEVEVKEAKTTKKGK